MKKVDTIIIGAGQAGLSLNYLLTQKGIDHLVLEKGRVAEDWRSRRWDNFHLLTQNKLTSLPGSAYQGKNPTGFGSKKEIIKFLTDYAKPLKKSILENTAVKSVTKVGSNFQIKTNKGTFEAKNVVVAIGWFHKPKIPDLSKKVPKNILQLHSSEYQNSKQLPKGAILVVGTGNSGIQIADDLQKGGRTVYLSVGKHRIFPRSYRGKDFIDWAKLLGTLDKTAEEATPEVKNAAPLSLYGRDETVSLKKLAQNGVNLSGHLNDIKNNEFIFADDLIESIEKGEAFGEAFKKSVDNYITDHNLVIPAEEPESPKKRSRIKSGMTNLDLSHISTIIWATGFQRDFSFLKVPVLDKDGLPIHKKGVSKIKGLYFIGLAWLSKYKSFFIFGVEEDAEYIVSKITA